MDHPEPSLPLPLPWPFPRETCKKRDLSDFVTDSSDPPMFSSDDQPANIEDYLQPRNKRQRRGPWYDTDDANIRSANISTHQRRRRGSFQRDLDSGVWMGSDELEEVEEEACIREHTEDQTAWESLEQGKTSDDHCISSLAARYLEDPGLRSGPLFPYWQQQPNDLDAFHKAQSVAIHRVEEYTDCDRSNLDLMGLNLCQLLPSTLLPLRFLTRDFPSSQNKQFDDFYRPIELYLANNQLTWLPGELYDLEHITVLSARVNQLKEISPAISRLCRLEELNLDNNKLHCLPFEMLDLLTATIDRFSAMLNPLLRPKEPLIDGHIRIDREVWRWRTSSPPVERAICQSAVAYLSIDGSSIAERTPAPSSTLHWPVGTSRLERVPKSPPQSERTITPSLFELALRTAYDSSNLSQLPFFLPPDCAPSVIEHLKGAWPIKSFGGQRCTVCDKSYLIPRTEWVEWWFRGKGSTRSARVGEAAVLGLAVLPLLRRGCSWACTPPDMGVPVVEGWTVYE